MRHLLLLATVLAAPALAQPAPRPARPTAATGPDSPATTAYKQAQANMMAGMEVPYTGDADRDFVDSMLPHHTGAIAMAQVEARYGSDPELKQMAHDIMVAQNKEVVFMRRWLLQHPPRN